MKKLLFMVIVLAFSCTGANATYEIKYNNAGAVINNPYSTTPQFGSNALFMPENIERAAQRNRRIRYEKQYYDSLKNSQNINVNINHNGYNPYTYNYPTYRNGRIYNYGNSFPRYIPVYSNRIYQTTPVTRTMYVY